MISGYTMVRNAITGDFPVEECAKSLAECCDEVLIGYAESDDGTRDLIEGIASRVDKVRIVDAPCDFSVRKAGSSWMIEWMDRVRRQIKGTYQIHLDADEILADWSIDEVRKAASINKSLCCNRLNFWGRTDRIVPNGYWCGSHTIRCAPSRFVLVSDFPVVSQVQKHAKSSTVEIFHYATLRKPAAFVAKSEAIQLAMAGAFDTRIYEAMKIESHWTNFFKFDAPFIEYNGRHPDVIKPWLRERGYSI